MPAFPPPGSLAGWNGRAVANARTWYATTITWPTPCARCGTPLTPNHWHLGHRADRQAHPELTWHTDNWQPECPRCSASSGASQGNSRRIKNKSAAMKNKKNAPRVFSETPLAGPLLPRSIHTPIPPGSAGDGAPRFLSPPASSMEGSLWSELRSWVAGEGLVLRPWQELVADRALEVDGLGRLVWRTVVVSTPRQSGKSWLIRALAIARAAHPELFGGEPQLVIHVANKHLAARRIHSQAWGWAGRRDLEVRTAQGMERVIWPDGSSWDALTLSNVYGASANLVMLDEVWDVPPEAYREGLRPTQVARQMPQLWALSTAHRKATGLMLSLLEQGRLGEGRVLVADWGAGPDDDPADPAVWRAVSPHWDEQRGDEMRLVAGSAGFAEQWLNVWPSLAVGGWLPSWPSLRADPPAVWLAVGVEATYGEPPVVAWAGTVGEKVVVSVTQAASTADAAAMVRAAGLPAAVGKSLLVDAVWGDVQVEAQSSTAARAVTDFRRLVDDDVLRHDGGAVLSDQVAGCWVDYGIGGARVTSAGRVDAIKAAVWAAQSARMLPELAAVF